MIIERIGDVLSIPSGIIVHGCNCQGVMGAGVAAQVKARFPEAYDVYRQAHTAHGLMLGDSIICPVHVIGGLLPVKYIVHAMIQEECGTNRRYANYEAIAQAFEDIKKTFAGTRLPIVFPRIGAGLAGGNWKIISTIIDETLGDGFTKILYKFGE